jgi:heat shock protein HslJ
MNTKAPLLFLSLTFTLIACTSGVAGAPPTGTPNPPTNPPATPAPPNPTNPPADPPNGAQPNLDGRQFISITVTDGDHVIGLVPGTVIRLVFQAGGSLSVQAGCNTMGGTFTIVDGKLVADSPWSMTEMGCDPARHAQDDWISQFLGSSPQFNLVGNDLVLTSGATTITFLDKEVAEPDQPLVGPTWTLSSIISGDAVSSVPMGVTATLKFNADGTVEVHSGCNSGGGSYAVEGDLITFGGIALTKMACLGPQMDVESAVITVLSTDGVTWAIDSGSLTLMAGDHGLQFSAG